MNNANLRRQDTTKGPPLRILCLDGGGVRGYSMLILIQELMHRTYVEIRGTAPKRHEIPKPCDHFDLIAGTGTGGLIAMMLGRLRMDVETCKEAYVRLTKRVFETDKTVAVIFKTSSTLFKASKLEEVIKECIREHTILGDEGNDDDIHNRPLSQDGPGLTGSDLSQGDPSNLSRGGGTQGVNFRGPLGPSRVYGNPNALLYDGRDNRTKTAVTAVYKGTPLNGPSTLLRSYDSRKEPAPEVNCRIWEAGRATCAIGSAFKPIQIGQSVFHDEGAGKFNPSPQILDEATLNEWPARDVGVFISIGTGKRPGSTDHQQAEWWEGFVGGSFGDFAEARRRLIAKIEACEDIHQYMMREHLSKRGVNNENYYRLNVEVGVGEFGMNEWSRLSDISTNTRMYLSRQQVQNIIVNSSSKLALIHNAKIRWERTGGDGSQRPYSWEESRQEIDMLSPADPMAAELPAGEYYELDTVRSRTDSQSQFQEQPLPQSYTQAPTQAPAQSPIQAGSQYRVHQYQDFAMPANKYTVPSSNRVSNISLPDTDNRMSYATVSPTSPQGQYYSRQSFDRFNNESNADRPPPLHVQHRHVSSGGPPVPPKTPITSSAEPDWTQSPRPLDSTTVFYSSPSAGPSPPRPLPYPDMDGPPPAVNMAKKPQYGLKF